MVQLVVTASSGDLKQVKVSAGRLRGPRAASIPAGRVVVSPLGFVNCKKSSPGAPLIGEGTGVAAAVFAPQFNQWRVTLLPGDLIYTGTPGSTRKLNSGDVVEVEIEGIGLLRNPVR